ncbi:MAG: formylglycine-generating enzyme family protein [Planctomycetia bacterium]|nr:formylglycine-generating enzyme family protein [Planctomycetia bacterium]
MKKHKPLLIIKCALIAVALMATLTDVKQICAQDDQIATVDALIAPGNTPGQRIVLKLGDLAIPFRWVPAGDFLMGTPEDEEFHDASEALHKVTLTKGFWILETETTQALWKKVMGDNPSEYKGDDKPVDTVSINDVKEFCGKLAKLLKLPEKHAFQLPTEAQWEYAARAGSSEPYAGKKLEDVAWFGDVDYGGTHPVATKKPNDWGLYDMCGNLWEWTADLYADYPTNDDGTTRELVDPKGATPEECPGMVYCDRGGCWDSKPYECRIGYRGFYGGDRKGAYVGFRFLIVP